MMEKQLLLVTHSMVEVLSVEFHKGRYHRLLVMLMMGQELLISGQVHVV